jgi:hypothetical protein
MRLDLLLKREDFARIFEQSLQKFLIDAFGNVTSVNWRRGFNGSNALLVNTKLNVIYSRNIDRSKFRSIVSEYAYHPNILRRFLQKTYIQFASSKYFEWLFVDIRVEVSPWVGDLDKLCIIPGNHSIRIVDLKLSRCRIVLKYGFDAQFINNEINLREKYSFLPLPKLLNVDSAGLWHEEVQVSALPLNRIDSQDIKNKALLEAQNSLLTLYDKTLVKVNISSYLESLHDSCCGLIAKLSEIYSQKDKDRINTVLRLLMDGLNELNDYEIELVQSHGDFQPANILIDNTNQQLYLIDWEYSAKRTLYYDALVFSTQCRFPHGLSERLRTLLSETNMSWKWCMKNTSTKLSKLELILFLIEDLTVRLFELQIPNMINKDRGLDIWLHEVEKWTSFHE